MTFPVGGHRDLSPEGVCWATFFSPVHETGNQRPLHIRKIHDIFLVPEICIDKEKDVLNNFEYLFLVLASRLKFSSICTNAFLQGC